jgi:malate dehydrogenase (oxaloacetate-decarboxylating)(NADP+)
MAASWRHHAAARPRPQQGHRLHRRRARRTRACAACCRRTSTPGASRSARAGELSARANRWSKYIHLIALQDRNETLFYRVVIDTIDEMHADHLHADRRPRLPEYGHIFRRPRGHVHLGADDRGRVADVLRNWPHPDVASSSSPTASASSASATSAPTAWASRRQALALHRLRRHRPDALPADPARRRHQQRGLLDDPLYIGLRSSGCAARSTTRWSRSSSWPRRRSSPACLVQFEDFANTTPSACSSVPRPRPCFNDDIQGTAAVSRSPGVLSALRVTAARSPSSGSSSWARARRPRHRDLIGGAGRRGHEGRKRARCWLFDSQGLVVAGRGDLAAHKQPYAHEHAPVADFLQAIER